MKERPILFNGPMVRAIREGRKTQTRRVVTLQNSTVLGQTNKALWDQLHHWDMARVDGPPDPIGDGDGYQYLHVPATGAAGEPVTETKEDWCWYRVRPRIDIGDRLWVREQFSFGKGWDSVPAGKVTKGEQVWYHADGSTVGGSQLPTSFGRVRPSIHMPRWACRLVLEVVSVRVERLVQITEDDAICEGMLFLGGLIDYPDDAPWADPGDPKQIGYVGARGAFTWAWDRINGKGSWALNPWVWVVEVRRVES